VDREVSVFDPPPRDRTPRGPTESDYDAQARLRSVEDKLLVIAGADGTNGKLGNLRSAFESEVASRRNWLLVLIPIAITSFLTGASALYVTGTKDGDQARTIEHLQTEISRLQVTANENGSVLASLRIELATLRAMTLAPRRGGRP
jgi:hypothetical protein